MSLPDTSVSLRVAGPETGLLPVPFISVIMPVRNEARHLRPLLLQLLTQDYDPDRFEVIVADGASTDATADIVRELMVRFANLHLARNPKRLASAGRNRAIAASQGDVIVIVDGHCRLPGRDYLQSVADAFLRSHADCLGRPQPFDVENVTSLQRSVAVARSSWLGHHPSSYVYASGERFVPAHSVAVAYQRHLFESAGLFDESFDACEDVELNQRLDRSGATCFLSDTIRVFYQPRATLPALFWQMFRYGKGRVQLLCKHPRTLSLPSVLPLCCLVAGLALLAGSAWWPRLMPVLLGALAAYGGVVGIVSVALAARARSWAVLLRLPAVFCAIHAGVALGSFMEAVTRFVRRGHKPCVPQLAPRRVSRTPARKAA